jgi:hypothetical protein
VRTEIVQQLDEAPGPVAVRVHSSGDFYSTEYIEMWKYIAVAHPAVHFWAYTRSWAVLELQDRLEELHRCPNFQLFASWDESMPAPPLGWRLSIVSEHGTAPLSPVLAQKLIRCPEEMKLEINCAACSHCIDQNERGVWFTAH